MFNYLLSSTHTITDGNNEMLQSEAAAMREKLHAYASSQLPGGQYWDPQPDIKKELDKSNDLC